MADETADETDYVRPFEWLTSPASLFHLVERINPSRILHVGSGSSILGEHLVETFPTVEECVNVDVDLETLTKMKERWIKNHGNDELASRLKFVHADLSCRSNSGLEQMDTASFDLILDKSTLDCLLCSEHGATGLLTHLYRLLNIGGTYLLVSFHEDSFLRPLLVLPDADWDIQHSVMSRQVEELVLSCRARTSRSTSIDKEVASLSGVTTGETTAIGEVAERSLNVFHCVKRGAMHFLDYDRLHEHVLAVNNYWYKNKNPIMTSQRQLDLKLSFGDNRLLSLQEAYGVLFTDAEREHLSFDLFMEDWHTYISDKNDIDMDTVSFDIALAFLDEMQ